MMTTTTTTTITFEPIYTDSQLKILALIPYLPASLSLIGSGSIIYSVLSTWQQQRRTSSIINRGGLSSLSVYDRIMLGLSCMEATCNIGFLVFGSWSIPKEAAALSWGANGTSKTCEVAGVFGTVWFGTLMYTAMLALYFGLRVRFQLTDDFLTSRKIETFLHIIPIVLVITISVVGVVGEYFNPLDRVSGVCWFRDYPPDCTKDPTIDCIRGENAMMIARICGSCIFLLAFVIIVVCMTLLVLQIMTLEYRLRRYDSHRRSTNSNISSSRNSRCNQWKRSQQVGKQALQYIAFCILCGIWIILTMFVPRKYGKANFPLAFLMKFLGPMQGFFNGIIYWNKKRTDDQNNNHSRRSHPSKAPSVGGQNNIRSFVASILNSIVRLPFSTCTSGNEDNDKDNGAQEPRKSNDTECPTESYRRVGIEHQQEEREEDEEEDHSGSMASFG